MWGKVYEVATFTGGPLSGARLQVWQDGSNYKLNVANDANGNNGDYAKVSIMSNGASTPLQFVEFADVDGTQFYYKPQSGDEGIIYVTPQGVAIVTES